MPECPYRDAETNEKCGFTAETGREIERHRHEKHGEPKWEIAFQDE